MTTFIQRLKWLLLGTPLEEKEPQPKVSFVPKDKKKRRIGEGHGFFNTAGVELVLHTAQDTRKCSDICRVENDREIFTNTQEYFIRQIDTAIDKGEYQTEVCYYPHHHKKYPEIVTWLQSKGFTLSDTERGGVLIKW